MLQRALIVYRVDKSVEHNIGVIHKLRGQVNGLSKQGIHVDYVVHDDRGIFLNQDRIYTRPQWENSSLFKYLFWNHLNTIDLSAYDLILIRYTLMIKPQYQWLRKVKTQYPTCLIAMDMPTFPYAGEWSGLMGYWGLRWDNKNAKDLSRWVDAMIHSGSHREIHGVRTIRIGNGIGKDEIGNKVEFVYDHQLQLIAIAKWRDWHGLDRLLEGMQVARQAYTTSRVHLHVVGVGDALDGLKQMVDRYRLDDDVTFYGMLYGDQLKDLMDTMHLGIGTLGLHRKGVFTDSSLKHRMYCARGLPFVLSTLDIDFSSDLNFVKYVSQDEQAISIDKLFSFYQRLDKESIRKSMLAFAKANLLWEVKMKQFVSAL